MAGNIKHVTRITHVYRSITSNIRSSLEVKFFFKHPNIIKQQPSKLS